jgi:hypothetical protein
MHDVKVLCYASVIWPLLLRRLRLRIVPLHIVITFFITVTTNSGPAEFGARKPLVRLCCGVRDEYRRIVAGHAVADVLYRPNGSISGWTEGGRINRPERLRMNIIVAAYPRVVLLNPM